jgi:hypothetical protein
MFSQGAIQKTLQHDPNPWWHYLSSWMVGIYVWFLLTPLILWFGRRFPPDRNHWINRTAIHLALRIAFATLQLSIESGTTIHQGISGLDDQFHGHLQVSGRGRVSSNLGWLLRSR